MSSNHTTAFGNGWGANITSSDLLSATPPPPQPQPPQPLAARTYGEGNLFSEPMVMIPRSKLYELGALVRDINRVFEGSSAPITQFFEEMEIDIHGDGA